MNRATYIAQHSGDYAVWHHLPGERPVRAYADRSMDRAHAVQAAKCLALRLQRLDLPGRVYVGTTEQRHMLEVRP